jgi:hypothetical protein
MWTKMTILRKQAVRQLFVFLGENMNRDPRNQLRGKVDPDFLDGGMVEGKDKLSACEVSE